MAELIWSRDSHTGEVRFKGVIEAHDIIAIDSPFDRRLLSAETETAADFLLAAELIFRRAQERAATTTERT